MSRSVTYTLSTTVNLGNFENLKPEITATAPVPDGVDPRTVLAKLQKFVEDELAETVKRQKRELGL